MDFIWVLVMLLGLNILTLYLRYRSRNECIDKPIGKLIAFFWGWNTGITLLVCLGMFLLWKSAVNALDALPTGSTDAGMVFNSLMVTMGSLVTFVLLLIGIFSAVVVISNLTNLTYCAFCLWKKLKTGVFSTVVQVLCSILYLALIVSVYINFLQS